MKTKLFCYVDETGQDTDGALFVVAVVITAAERETLRGELEEIETSSKKGTRKWIKSRPEQRLSYMKEVLQLPELKGRLRYSVYHHTTEYMMRTVLATAQAITTFIEEDYKATVFVDGLPGSKIQWFGNELRRLYVRTEKVRGVKDEESDSLMRLADALAGFVRAGLTDDHEVNQLFEQARKQGAIHES
jgi:hypothetical protein